MNNEYPADPAWIQWLEDRHEEAVKAQDEEAEKRQQEKREYWLAKTEGGVPC